MRYGHRKPFLPWYFILSKLLSTRPTWRTRSDSSSPADLLSSCSVGSQSRWFLRGLITPIRTRASFLGNSGAVRPWGFRRAQRLPLKAYLPFAQQYRARAKASQVGIPVRHVSSMPTTHTHTNTHTQPSAASPGFPASFPSITIYTWQPGSEHNMKRILAICGRLLTNHGT